MNNNLNFHLEETQTKYEHTKVRTLAEKIYGFLYYPEEEKENIRSVDNLGLQNSVVRKLYGIIHKLDNFVHYLVWEAPSHRTEILTKQQIQERVIPQIARNLEENSGIIRDYEKVITRLGQLQLTNPQEKVEFLLRIGPFVGVTETFEEDFPNISLEAQKGAMKL